MKIGIIGSGNIGSTLGKVFTDAGHEVFFSSRHPDELKDLARDTGAQYGSLIQAAEFGEIILFAFPFGKLEEVKQVIGNLHEKILIDINNYYPGRDGADPARTMSDHQWRQSEYTAHVFPEARIVKAFNSIYYKNLESFAFRENDRLAIPVASNDSGAKRQVMTLMEEIGYDPVDIGNLTDSKIFEPDEKLYNLKVTHDEMIRMK